MTQSLTRSIDAKSKHHLYLEAVNLDFENLYKYSLKSMACSQNTLSIQSDEFTMILNTIYVIQKINKLELTLCL